jgi:hypothetical protein
MTQTELVLAALTKGEKLTPLDALRRFGCFRLGARIWDLKRAGYTISTEIIEVDGGARVARYSLGAP